MHTRIKITLLRRSQPLREYLIDAPARCLVGRAHDCTIQVPLIEEFADVSRRHCELEIEQDQLHVRDLRSLNGTYVNGAMIGQSDLSHAAGTCVGDAADAAETTLRSGDEIRLGRKARLVVEFFTVAEESVRDMQTVIIKPPR